MLDLSIPHDRPRRSSALPSPARTPYISSRRLSVDDELLQDAIPDVLEPGDIVGPRTCILGEPISVVVDDAPVQQAEDVPAAEFEVVRRLGAGSYAVVYLVREVLSRALPSDSGHSILGSMDLDLAPQETVYGKEYAIKCLSKADLDEEALDAQMTEVTIHQSLRPHPNIVTLHRTLSTSSFLLLLLEYVPGEDLFYFLEQSRDHYDSDPSHSSNVTPSRTPPTPGLLASSDPSQLLSPSRLRLVASMFAQMCEAVAACHAQQVFHRDIKPENFIVTDGWISLPDGRRERKVVVKLSDFGLSTTDIDSSDMDCGSAPYMSFECRNNVAPTYKPRGADVWSLGIVLINMLYHHNPWSDTTHGACPSFERFRREPVSFFIQRFTGMTLPVAEKLAKEVFCILPDPADDSPRISAGDLGAWARDLPSLFGTERPEAPVAPQVHPITAAAQLSHRPSSRNPSTAPGNRSPITRGLSMSLDPLVAKDLNVPAEIDENEELQSQPDAAESRSSTNRRVRKRGARKGKGASNSSAREDVLEHLAAASQSLAREISKASRAASVTAPSVSSTTSSRASKGRYEPVAMYAMPSGLCTMPPPVLVQSNSVSSISTPSISKKPSKWKLGFGRTSSTGKSEDVTPETVRSEKTATAANVSNLIMGLTSTPVPPSQSQTGIDAPTWARGRQTKGHQTEAPFRRGTLIHGHESWAPSSPPSTHGARATSPSSSIRSHGQNLSSSASSITSSNWRSSMASSAGTSTSAFTRYSNSSVRSVSTAATSVSSSSWRSNAKPPSTHEVPSGNVPKNIKLMSGVPWELGQAPREITGEDGFGSPPPRTKRPRKPKDSKLDTISERPFTKPSPRMDASTSTTDLNGNAVDVGEEGVDGPKKVAKGQINALAKMLSALRR